MTFCVVTIISFLYFGHYQPVQKKHSAESRQDSHRSSLNTFSSDVRAPDDVLNSTGASVDTPNDKQETIPEQQEAEADIITDPDFWVAVVASAMGSGALDGVKVLIDQQLYKWVQKKSTDSNSDHGEGGHVKQLVTVSGTTQKRWYCPADIPDGECGAEDASKKKLEDAGHCKNYRVCEENPTEEGKIPGCGGEIYDCTNKYHNVQTCPVREDYRKCKGGHDNCGSCGDATCGYDDSTCGYDDSTCCYDDSTCCYDDSISGYSY